jgi:DnaJ-class molecular chaperone
MRDGPLEDYYALLRVDRTATTAELRRSYRLLALRYHPDRAGPDGTEIFQRIARAYAVLSDAATRMAYDGQLRRSPSPAAPGAHNGGYDRAYAHHGDHYGPGGRVSWRMHKRSAPPTNLLQRLSGPLEALIAADIARRAPDGLVDLLITREEATFGGTAMIEAAVEICCPTCGGSAQRYVLWCRRCEYAGSVIDQVAFRFEIPAWVPDGTAFTFASDPSGLSPPLRLRLRIR